MRLSLLPVLELEPSSYPFAEAGADLPFIENTFYLVPLAAITDPAVIAQLLAAHLQAIPFLQALSDLQDLNAVFRGGYLLQTESHTIEPNCCADIGNITSWEAAAAYRDPAWLMVWIGHPYLYCRFNGSLLEFSLPTESSEEPQTAFTVDPADLQSGVIAARAAVIDFGERLRPALHHYSSPDLINPLLDILLWGEYPE